MSNFRLDGKPSVVSFKREGINRGILVIFDQSLIQVGDGSEFYVAAADALSVAVTGLGKGDLVDSITGSDNRSYLRFKTAAASALTTDLVLVHGGGAANPDQDIVGISGSELVTLAVADGPNALIDIQPFDPAVGYVSSAALSPDNMSLTIDFSVSTPTNVSLLSTYELAGGPARAAIDSVVFPGPSAFARATLNLAGIDAHTTGLRISVRIAAGATNAVGANLTQSAGLHLRWRPVQDPLEAIPLLDTLGPILAYNLAGGERNALNEVSKNIATGEIIYDGLSYTVTINEPQAGLRNITAAGDWTLRSITRSGAVADVATPALTVSCGFTNVTTCAIGLAGNISFNSRAADPVMAYFIGLTGTGANAPRDRFGNRVLQTYLQAPAGQRARTSFTTPVAIFDNATDEFWVVIGFTDNPGIGPGWGEGNIRIAVNSNGGPITGASAVADSLRDGAPAGVTLPGSIPEPANTIHFRVDPSGTLDGGQSATGAEFFTVTLPQNFLSGTNSDEQAVRINAQDNGAPEIRSFELASQAKTVSAGGVLGDIVYRMTFTEPLATAGVTMALENALQLYAVSGDKDTTDRMLAPGLASPVGSAVAAQVAVAVDATDDKVYTATFSGVGNAGMSVDVNSYYPALAASAFGSGSAIQDSAGYKLEDCEGSAWYASGSTPRFTARTTPCSAQNAADAPLPGNAAPPALTMVAGSVGNGSESSPYLIARAGLRVSTLAARMAHFRLVLSPNGTISRATPYSAATGDNIVDFDAMQPGEPRRIHWQFNDSKGFAIGANRTAMWVRFVPDVAFGRSLITAATDAMTIDVPMTFEAITFTVTGYPSDRAVVISGADDAVSFTRNSSPTQVTLAGEQARLTIAQANNPNVFFPGDAVGKMTAGVWGAGNLLAARLVKLAPDAEERRPIVITGIREVGGGRVMAVSQDDTGLTLEVSYVGPSAGTYSATASASAQAAAAGLTATLGSPAFSPDDSTSPGMVTLPFTIGGLSGQTLLPINVTLAYSGTPGQSVTARANVAILPTDAEEKMTENRGTDRGVMARIGGRLRLIKAQGGARLLPGPIVMKGLSTTDTLILNVTRSEAESDAGVTMAMGFEGDGALILNFELQNVVSGVQGGQFVGGIGGIVIPMARAGQWGVQKLVGGQWETIRSSAVGIMIGMYNSGGLDCQLDSGDSTSPYRDDDGDLVADVMGDCMVLYITDGGSYDSDGQVNGIIIDPANIAEDLRPAAVRLRLRVFLEGPFQ